MKRGLFYVVSGLVVAGFSSVGIPLASAQQDKYPSRAVEIIIPYDPGGPTDRVMRVIGEQLPEALKASIVQINRPGGGGIAGAVFVKQQKPDGYTLLAHASGFQITPLLDRNCPYKLEEFKPLARFTQGPLVLAVKKDSPWKSVEDFLAAAKAAPGKVTVGIPGVGTIQDFVVRLMERSSHNELNPIVLKGDGPNATALLGGHIQASVAGITALAPHLKSGELRGLAITTAERYEGFNDIPTFREKGLDEATIRAWVGIFAPANIPDDVFKVLDAALQKAATSPTAIETLKKMGSVPGYLNASDFDKSIKSEVERFKTVIKPEDVK